MCLSQRYWTVMLLLSSVCLKFRHVQALSRGYSSSSSSSSSRSECSSSESARSSGTSSSGRYRTTRSSMSSSSSSTSSTSSSSGISSSSSSSSFFESIGSPRFISAPMVDQSELAFRLLVRKNGADLAFSQMMHARNFMLDPKYRSECIDWNDYRNSNGSEDESRQLDSQLIVQLAGDNPDTLVRAGRFVHHDVSAVDLNLGCPQRIAKTGGYGAYLLPNKALVVKCLSALVTGLDCPVTAKIRVLASEEETLELCRAIEATGVSMLTVHGRTVESNKLFVGEVNWDIIRKIKQAVSIPVVANGGIENYSDALRCLEETGCDGVMSSEALLENPKLFSAEGDRMFREEYVKSQLATVGEYLAILDAHQLPRPLFQVTRSHLFKMMHRFVDCQANADLREQLATGDFDRMKDVYLQLQSRMAGIDFDTRVAEERGMIGMTSWYHRHRDDRAAARILSLPRRRPLAATKLIGADSSSSSSSSSSSASTDVDDASLPLDTAEDTKEKLSALKARLAEKRRLQPQSVSSSNSRFSQFIAKVDSNP